MNVLYQRVTPTIEFPWFDEYKSAHQICKVYNDGGCYIAIPPVTGQKKHKKVLHFRTFKDDLFDQFYLSGLKLNLTGKDLSEHILNGLRQVFPNDWTLRDFVSSSLNRISKNLFARKKRFRRKAFLNTWNYFVTITYSDELQSEESFKKRLKKCLSNLHTRRGWLYMGVFERGPKTGRLHFHALMYIPEGEMICDLYQKRKYSTEKHKMVETHVHPFFEERFGENDFAELSDAELRRGNTMQYLLKYISKSDERIMYSRGIPTEIYVPIAQDDIICEIVDFVTKYILFNDVIDDEDAADINDLGTIAPPVPLTS